MAKSPSFEDIFENLNNPYPYESKQWVMYKLMKQLEKLAACCTDLVKLRRKEEKNA